MKSDDKLDSNEFDYELSVLKKLPELAKDYSPNPDRKVVIEAAPAKVRRLRTNPFSYAAAVMILLIVSIWQFSGGPSRLTTEEPLSFTYSQPDEFMHEIKSLTDNALPEVYLMIQGESDFDLEEDDIEWFYF